MDTVLFTRILVAVILCANLGDSLQIKEESFLKNEAICAELSKDPYFDIEQVVGKSWRIYYTWNVKMENKCLDMTFKNATTMVSFCRYTRTNSLSRNRMVSGWSEEAITHFILFI